MVHKQGALPVVDVLKIDVNNTIIDTFSMPLLPNSVARGQRAFLCISGTGDLLDARRTGVLGQARRMDRQRAGKLSVLD